MGREDSEEGGWPVEGRYNARCVSESQTFGRLSLVTSSIMVPHTTRLVSLRHDGSGFNLRKLRNSSK